MKVGKKDKREEHVSLNRASKVTVSYSASGKNGASSTQCSDIHKTDHNCNEIMDQDIAWGMDMGLYVTIASSGRTGQPYQHVPNGRMAP